VVMIGSPLPPENSSFPAFPASTASAEEGHRRTDSRSAIPPSPSWWGKKPKEVERGLTRRGWWSGDDGNNSEREAREGGGHPRRVASACSSGSPLPPENSSFPAFPASTASAEEEREESARVEGMEGKSKNGSRVM
jgi:hypothetical protein